MHDVLHDLQVVLGKSSCLILILSCFVFFVIHISGLYYEFVYFSVISGIFWLKLRDLSKNLIQRLKRTADTVGF